MSVVHYLTGPHVACGTQAADSATAQISSNPLETTCRNCRATGNHYQDAKVAVMRKARSRSDRMEVMLDLLRDNGFDAEADAISRMGNPCGWYCPWCRHGVASTISEHHASRLHAKDCPWLGRSGFVVVNPHGMAPIALTHEQRWVGPHQGHGSK